MQPCLGTIVLLMLNCTSYFPHSIATRELFPVAITVETWGNSTSNSKILFFSDNQAAVQVMNKKSCKVNVIMHLERRLVVACLYCSIRFKAKHIKGTLNIVPVQLSRYQLQKGKLTAPWLSQSRHTYPVTFSDNLDYQVKDLLHMALSKSTISAYRHSWRLLLQFL